MSSSVGQGTPDKAKYTEDIGNIDDLLQVIGNADAGPFKPDALDAAKGIVNVTEISKENQSTSDKKIKEKTGDRTDANGKSLTKTNYWINRSNDTISVASGNGDFNGEVYYPGDTIDATITNNDGTIIKEKKYPSR